ncbi:MAG: family 10 glycosylhydrolase [Gemmatimonadaceae bacterium]
MRHLTAAAALLLAAAAITACSDGPLAPAAPRVPRLAVGAAACGVTTTQTLRAPNGAALGTAEVWNDATDLHVLVTAAAGWVIRETHIHPTLTVATIPLRGDGYPDVGRFSLGRGHRPPVAQFDYVIPLASFGAVAGADVFVPVNPIVQTVASPVTSAKLWGGTQVIDPRSAATQFAHTVGRCDTPLRAEARALWVNRFEYNSAAKIIEILDKARSANFNVIYFQVRGQGDAYYRSDLEPCAVALCGSLGNGFPSYDPLEVAVREAHARGLELHAWLNAFTGWASPAGNNAAYCALLRDSRPGSPQHMLRAHPEWAMVSNTGVVMTCANSQASEYAWVSPGIPEVRTHLARVAADIVRRYRVDGIHLDRVRYPGTTWSYDAPSLAAFRALYGRSPSSTTDPAWEQFRRDMVSLAVRETYDSITTVRREAVLSAAVWPIYNKDVFGWPSSSGVSQYYQDPRAWARGGFLDVAVAMTYFSINEQYCSYVAPPGGTVRNPDWACLLDDHLRGIDAASGRHTYIGIEGDKGVAEIERQIRLGRERGVKGFSFYSFNAAEAAGLWPVLASGLFSERSTVPPMPWKVSQPLAARARTGIALPFTRRAGPSLRPGSAPPGEVAKEFEEEPNVPPRSPRGRTGTRT